MAETFTIRVVRTSRAATPLDDLLTDRFDGTVTCDRAKMDWRCGRLQHPDRRVKRLGHGLKRPTKRLFGVWARYHDVTISVPPVRRRAGLYWRTDPAHSIDAAGVLSFLRDFLQHLRGKVIVVWDGGSNPRGRGSGSSWRGPPGCTWSGRRVSPRTSTRWSSSGAT